MTQPTVIVPAGIAPAAPVAVRLPDATVTAPAMVTLDGLDPAHVDLLRTLADAMDRALHPAAAS